MWLLVLWAGVVVLAATAVMVLRAPPDGDPEGTPAHGALVLTVGLLALVLGIAATVGGWGMGWHGSHIGPMGAGSHMGVGSSTTSSRAPLPAAVTLEVEAGDAWFDPATLTVPADTPFNIRVANVGDAYHDLTLATLEVALTVDPGESSVAGIDGLPTGSYPFECTVPGHAAAGMRGTLQVT